MPPAALMESIGGMQVLWLDSSRGIARLGFTARPGFCHTNGTIVQGGFVTAWLDCAMAFAALNRLGGTSALATLEIKVSFLQAVGPGRVVAEGRVQRLGRRVAFLEGSLFDESGRTLATATTTGLLAPRTHRR